MEQLGQETLPAMVLKAEDGSTAAAIDQNVLAIAVLSADEAVVDVVVAVVVALL